MMINNRDDLIVEVGKNLAAMGIGLGTDGYTNEDLLSLSTRVSKFAASECEKICDEKGNTIEKIGEMEYFGNLENLYSCICMALFYSSLIHYNRILDAVAKENNITIDMAENEINAEFEDLLFRELSKKGKN